jgi:metal-sulfur cluster biosynthetic enzyme
MTDKTAEDNKKLEEQVKDLLFQVYDPEILVNIVDMGLVYGVEATSDNSVRIDITLTTPACPLTNVLEEQIRIVLEGTVETVDINWVFEPVWNFDKMTEAGKEQLSAIGYSL